MSRQDPFFDMPLCSLAFGSTIKERLDHVISWSVVESGKKIWAKKGDDCEGVIDGFLSINEGPGDFDESDALHKRTMLGLITARQTHRSIEQTVAEHATLNAFVSRFEAKYGADAHAWIRTDIFLDALMRALRAARLPSTALVLASRSVLNSATAVFKSTRLTVAALTLNAFAASSSDPNGMMRLAEQYSLIASSKVNANRDCPASPVAAFSSALSLASLPDAT